LSEVSPLNLLRMYFNKICPYEPSIFGYPHLHLALSIVFHVCTPMSLSISGWDSLAPRLPSCTPRANDCGSSFVSSPQKKLPATATRGSADPSESPGDRQGIWPTIFVNCIHKPELRPAMGMIPRILTIYPVRENSEVSIINSEQWEIIWNSNEKWLW
jgi:hypothetical protein